MLNKIENHRSLHGKMVVTSNETNLTTSGDKAVKVWWWSICR